MDELSVDSNALILVAMFVILTAVMFRVIRWVSRRFEKYEVRARIRRWRGKMVTDRSAKKPRMPLALERKIVANAVYDGLDAACDKGLLTAEQVHRWSTKIGNAAGLKELLPDYVVNHPPVPNKKKGQKYINWMKAQVQSRIGSHWPVVRLPGFMRRENSEQENKIAAIFSRLNNKQAA